MQKNPSSSPLVINNNSKLDENDILVKMDNDYTSVIVLSISGGIIIMAILFFIMKRYRNKFSVTPCKSTEDNKGKKIRKNKSLTKPRDYILEILPTSGKNLPPLPAGEEPSIEPPIVPPRVDRLTRLVNIKRKLREYKENDINSK